MLSSCDSGPVSDMMNPKDWWWDVQNLLIDKKKLMNFKDLFIIFKIFMNKSNYKKSQTLTSKLLSL